MGEIQRFDMVTTSYVGSSMEPVADGDFVRFEDHERAVKAERERITALIYAVRKGPHTSSFEAGWNAACDAIERRFLECEEQTP